MRPRLVRTSNAFFLMTSSKEAKINIVEASLPVRRVKVAPGILLAHARALSKSTAKYPVTRVEVKAVLLHAGVHNDTLDNARLGQLPKRITIGFVDKKAFNNTFKLNPFNFQNYGINYLSLYVDGLQIPTKPIQLDIGKTSWFVDAYFLNEGNRITRTSYPYGYCLFAFDLTPHLSAYSNTHWNLVRHGGARIEVRFDAALTSTVNCIVYAEYDNVLEIDLSR